MCLKTVCARTEDSALWEANCEKQHGGLSNVALLRSGVTFPYCNAECSGITPNCYAEYRKVEPSEWYNELQGTLENKMK